MLGVPGVFIVAAVLYISDADPAPTPRFRELITTAIQSIDETVELLPDGIPPMIALLEEANNDLREALESNETPERFNFLKNALKNEIEGLSTAIVLCGDPEICQKVGDNLAVATVKILTAVVEICESQRDAIDRIYVDVLSRHGTNFELEMMEIGTKVLTEMGNSC